MSNFAGNWPNLDIKGPITPDSINLVATEIFSVAHSAAEMIANPNAIIGSQVLRMDLAPAGQLYTCNSLPPTVVTNWSPSVGSGTRLVSASRPLTLADDGLVLEMGNNLSLTVTAGLPSGFAVGVIPLGTTSVIAGPGVFLNGLATPITRTAASNYVFSIVGRVSTSNSYVVSGV